MENFQAMKTGFLLIGALFVCHSVAMSVEENAGNHRPVLLLGLVAFHLNAENNEQTPEMLKLENLTKKDRQKKIYKVRENKKAWGGQLGRRKKRK